MNETYSFKDFTGQDLSGLPASEFNNTTIIGSCFSQEYTDQDVIPKTAGKSIFPAGMTGVTFERCNLDNVNVPAGNTIVGGTNKVIQTQNDLHNWVMGYTTSWKPVEPIMKKEFIKLGISINPADIPLTKQTDSATHTKEGV